MKNTLPFLLAGTFMLTACDLALAQVPAVPAGDNQRPAVAIPGTATDDTPRGNAKLTGVVVDSTTGKPVEFASIALINAQTKKPIDGTVADDKGQFTLNKLPQGEFQVLISFVGYRNKTVSSVKLDRRGDVALGTVKLAPDVRTLNEVQVVGQQALVEEKVDRIVYNADKDVTAKGGDATDIMRKVPLLSVDLDGNVSLRGSSNVRVLINNKPSTIVASSVADALKQIPADMIKTVEVITSPSAKYDAEGSAGIINIITKKTTLQGFTLNVDSGVGNRGSNLGLNGNLRTGKMGFSLSGYGRANYNVRGAFANTQQIFGSNGTTTTEQSASTRNQGVFGQYTLGWDYDISKNSAITASLRYGARNNTVFQDNFLTKTSGLYFPVYNARNVKTDDLSGTVDANVDYTRTFAKPQQEMSISAQYSRNNRNNNFIADILSATDFSTIASRQQNLNDSYNQESTFQADYQTPIGKNQLIEFGGKGIYRQVESSFRYNFATGPNAGFQMDENRPGNTLNYDQTIGAGYVSYTITTKSKFTIKAGTRYEFTSINANYSRTQAGEQGAAAGEDLGIPSYSNLVPSINISKALKGGKTIKLAYNRRLQRPGIQFLNPNINNSNPTNITQGNPLLSPELTDNFELSNSAYIKNVYLNATLFYRRTNNEITSVRDTNTTSLGEVANPTLPQPIRTTYLNIGRQEAYGINLFGNATLFSKWQIGGGFDAYYASLTNNSTQAIYRASNAGWVVTGRFFTSLNIKNGWGLQGFGFIRGKQIQLQGYQGGFAFYSLGMKKDMKNKRGSFGIAAENFFNHPFTVRSESSSPIFAQNSTTSLYNAGIRANFSYKFGKLSFDQPQRKRGRSVENDDVKGGEGGEGGGQQPAAQPAQGGGGRRPK
ncbi:TonB-dependent receptor domain-containing protein [Spirosoma utsteinense]|uniref:Outer membrane receptor protein involved in Fe transport n=1 Tax=Spirosoma utsteinense TaxID=2585773 RepID=A0ABR6VZI5_9BACT|nr:outer membrane beta-barrel family protein [Spirosoma utsteinense]MBC3784719.1 outer membrane receptor protein involved in Fe transport [Spirosoma utsteinense]MBC3789527.1 outer membrane receptor protein involved in Fe transport [Spirosoma utsteinense]